MRGPIDYIIVGFVGNKFDGSILKAIGDAIDTGVIALIAVALLLKDQDGEVNLIDILEAEDPFAVEFAKKYHANSDDITSEDINEVAELLENDTAAGLLVVEQLWAKPLKQAILNADGVLVAEGRIHPEAAAELETKGV